MAKRIIWKRNHLVNVKLREDLYTPAQMLVDPYIMFFALFNQTGRWEGVELSKTPTLFCVPVGRVFLKNCVENKITEGVVADENLTLPKYWIRPCIVYDGSFPFKGGDLIEIDTNRGDTHAGRIVKPDLDVVEDAEAIRKYELTNMWGDEDTTKRLIHFYETGVDQNPLKEKVFR
jgi:hypothetical protein